MAAQSEMVEEVEIVAASNPTIPSASGGTSTKMTVGIVHPDSAATQIK